MINIKSDSRRINKGDIFVALNGIHTDGHDYVDTAIKRGASKVVVSKGDYNIETIKVDDTRKYLNNYLKDNYGTILDEMCLIGITGTNGKTTSAFLTYQALNELGYKCGYIGTIGYYLDRKIEALDNTSPDICEMYEMIVNAYDKGYKYMVIEVSSQGIAYHRVENILFDYAVFTNLTPEHLDYHKTMDNYALAKQQLFKQLKHNGMGIVNIDDSYSFYYQIGNYISYGFHNSDYMVTDYQTSANGTSFTINNKINIKTKLLGKYNIYNTLVAYILVKLITKEDNVEVFNKINPPSGRMDIVKYKSNTIIIDYAHTPDALENIFNTVKDINYNHLYTVFGCTGSRDREKRPIMTSIVLSLSDYAIITSDDLHDEDFSDIILDMLENNVLNNYTVEEDRYKAVELAISKLDKNDILLILGKGHEEYILVKDKKIPYNDKEAVLKLLDIKEVVNN